MTKNAITPTNLIIKQDVIEAYEPTLRRFFSEVFGMDYDGILVTDAAQLKDFSFSGEDQPDLDQYPDLKAAYAGWDKWVIGRINELYGFEPGTIDTRIPLTQLMARIEERTAQRVH